MIDLIYFLQIEDSPEKVKQLLQGVLDQRRFAGLKYDPSQDPLRRLIEFLKGTRLYKYFADLMGTVLKSLFNFISSSSVLSYVIMIILLSIIIGYLVIVIRRRIAGRLAKNGDGREEEESIDPIVREKQGLAAAVAGDFTGAIRHLYKSLLLFFNLKGIMEYRISRTNRETEVLLARSESEEFRKSFTRMNRIFEDKVYALRPCHEYEFLEFQEAYEFCRRGIREL